MDLPLPTLFRHSVGRGKSFYRNMGHISTLTLQKLTIVQEKGSESQNPLLNSGVDWPDSQRFEISARALA